jgi:hypothetical protein
MTPKQETATPTVADIIQESGITAMELSSVTPHVSPYTWRNIRIGRIPGHSVATDAVRALKELSGEHEKTALRYQRAAARIEAAYPDPGVKLDDDEERPVLLAAAKGDKSFSTIAKEHGTSRQAVWETVTRYERRTGIQLPRYGRPRRNKQGAK